MQRFLILAICVAVSSAASVKVNPFAAAAPSITPKGVVSPVTRCGGDSTFVQLRVDKCDGVCTLIPGTNYPIELDILPSKAAPSLKLKMTTVVFGTTVTIIEKVLDNSSVQPGNQYTVKVALTPNDILSGRTITLRSEITHGTTGALEVCISNEVKIA